MNTNGNTEMTNETKAVSNKKKDSKSAYGAKGRTNVLTFDPEDVVVVTDPKSALYDERVNLPVDENMVKNLMFHGQIKPVVIRKNPETGQTEVVAGRQLTRAMREANKRLRERGEEPLLLQATIKRGDDGTLAGIVASENAIRQAESPLHIAKKMERLLGLGKTEKDLCVIFGFGVQTVKNHLTLLDCTAVVRNAVESGKVSVTHAVALAKLDPDKQRETVDNMLKAQAGEAGGAHQKAKKTRQAAEAAGIVQSKVRGKKEIAEFRAKVEEGCDPEFRSFVLNVLDWVMGGREPRVPRGTKKTAAA